MPDREEDPARLPLLKAVFNEILDEHLPDDLVARYFLDRAIPKDFDLWMFERPLGHDLGGAELIPPMDEEDAAPIFRQEDRLFDGAISPSDDIERLTPENRRGPIADSAGGDPFLPIFPIAGPLDIEPFRRSARRNDERMRLDLGR